MNLSIAFFDLHLDQSGRIVECTFPNSNDLPRSEIGRAGYSRRRLMTPSSCCAEKSLSTLTLHHTKSNMASMSLATVLAIISAISTAVSLLEKFWAYGSRLFGKSWEAGLSVHHRLTQTPKSQEIFRYVSVIEGEPLTPKQRRDLDYNNSLKNPAPVGFRVITIQPQVASANS
jgi:hypothetical protein